MSEHREPIWVCEMSLRQQIWLIDYQGVTEVCACVCACLCVCVCHILEPVTFTVAGQLLVCGPVRKLEAVLSEV